MSFLEVLTRTFGQRPQQIARCRGSLASLRDPDWTQRIIMDAECRGVAWANRNLATIQATGEWVWVLDDDDLCCNPDLLGHLRGIVAAERPDVVMVRCHHGQFGMLPPPERWEQRPVMGQIGGSCAICSRDTWNLHRDGWAETYAGDFWFINRLWDVPGIRIAWLPVTAVYDPISNNGAPERAS